MTINSLKKSGLSLALYSLAFPLYAQADIETEFSVGYNSDYVFRGADLGNNAFEYGLDVSGTSDCGCIWNAGIWSISPNNSADDELDIYASLSKEIGTGLLTLGITNYQFDSAPDDSEVFLGYSTEIEEFSAAITLFYGFDGAIDENVLLEGSLGYTQALCEKVDLNLHGTVGYLIDDALNRDGYAYSSVKLSLASHLSEQMTLTPYISYANGDSTNIGAGRFNGFFSGVTLSYQF